MRPLYALTITLGSLLLFVVQPMLAKALLPLVGGAPASWIVSMLFFQILLLLGYIYAAILCRYLAARHQMILHLGLHLLAWILYSPLMLQPSMLADMRTQPELALLLTLLGSVGLPYFLLAANATLIQRWYFQQTAQSPYFLFSVSNAGSLAGLLGYPFVLEWLLDLEKQMRLWSGAYAFLVLCLGALLCLKGVAIHTPQEEDSTPATPDKQSLSPVKLILLGFAPSSLFLSTTLSITTDIASFPLLWVMPLSLYLISFIIAFSASGSSVTQWTQKLHLVAICVLLALVVMPPKTSMGMVFAILLALAAFSIIALSCHGKAASLKPHPSKLTRYYIWLSVGGALGGAFNTAAPYLFTLLIEHYIGLAASLLALPAAQFLPRPLRLPFGAGVLRPKVLLSLIITLLLTLSTTVVMFLANPPALLLRDRSFFGISTVWHDITSERIVLMHGRITHGFQSTLATEKLTPSAYYAPLHQLLERMPDAFFEKPIGVIGLGTGTCACLARKNQSVDFFEIDPLVIHIASQSGHFSYLRDCPARITTYLGDGRLELIRQPDARYHLLVLDAFSSDAIPAHLLTHEAFSTYTSKVSEPHGLIAFHISNRFLDVKAVLARIILKYGWSAHYLDYKGGSGEYDTPSQWVIAAPAQSPWLQTLAESGFRTLQPLPDTPLWSDGYSSILSVIKRH